MPVQRIAAKKAWRRGRAGARRMDLARAHAKRSCMEAMAKLMAGQPRKETREIQNCW